MKYRYSHKLLLYVLILASLTACDSFLDIKPKDQVILEKTKDYDALLNMYSMINTVGTTPVFTTDDVYLPNEDKDGLTIKSMYPEIQNSYGFNEEIYSKNEEDLDWHDSYKQIYTYNIVINGVLNSTEGTEEFKKQLYAEALLFRAFNYLNLATVYAKPYNPNTASKDLAVPLVLKADISPQTLTRATVEELYSKIITDLEEAIPLLPVENQLNAYRGSKPAALGLLARIYLYKRDFDKAAQYAQEALKFKSDLIDLNKYQIVDSTKTSGRIDVPERLQNPENIYVRVSSAQLGMTGRSYINPELINLFDKDTDRRFQLYISDVLYGKKRDYYIWAQGLDPNIGISTPELYLTAAEALVRTGKVSDAMAYLNTLRKNRYKNPTDITVTQADEALKLVVEERRKEFMMTPPFRLADIKRYAFDSELKVSIKRDVDGKVFEIPSDSKMLVFPIPYVVLTFNPDMEQNDRKM